uniref:Uncharacterized protein n=1 Tax=Rhizophora mucronata TaxID=61149 RepID=A0A2P2NSK9_RHIMU
MIYTHSVVQLTALFTDRTINQDQHLISFQLKKKVLLSEMRKDALILECHLNLI